MSTEPIIMYTDGAAQGNPGPGGYGTLLMKGDKGKEFSGGYAHTTNNRMELMALIVGLEALKKDGLHVTVYSDSKYVVDSIEKGWLQTWIKTNFKGGKKNKDLWIRFYKLSQKQHLTLKWVKGHADNAYNNRCDYLATTAAKMPNLPPDTGYMAVEDTLF